MDHLARLGGLKITPTCHYEYTDTHSREWWLHLRPVLVLVRYQFFPYRCLQLCNWYYQWESGEAAVDRSVTLSHPCCPNVKGAAGRLSHNRDTNTFPSSSRQQLVTTQHTSWRDVTAFRSLGPTSRSAAIGCSGSHDQHWPMAVKRVGKKRGLRPLLMSQRRRGRRSVALMTT